MFGDEYYIKLQYFSKGKTKPETLWEKEVYLEEEDTSLMSDMEFIEILKSYLPKAFYEQSDVVKVYGIIPSTGDQILTREIEIERNNPDEGFQDSVDIANAAIKQGVNNGCGDAREGIKYDDGKPRVSEFLQDFEDSILEVTKVWEFGANKYGKSNWKDLKNARNRYTNAMLRHLLKEPNNMYDDETGLLHATHICFNALARLHFILQEEKEKNNESN